MQLHKKVFFFLQIRYLPSFSLMCFYFLPPPDLFLSPYLSLSIPLFLSLLLSFLPFYQSLSSHFSLSFSLFLFSSSLSLSLSSYLILSLSLPLSQETTKLLLTRIPFFKSVVISSFDCPHCHYTNNKIQPASALQPQGCIHEVEIRTEKVTNFFMSSTTMETLSLIGC